MSSIVTLGSLARGQRATIVQVQESETTGIGTRLLEMGFLEGTFVELVHEAPFSKDPIVVRVRGTLIAIRRSEANLVEVVIDHSSLVL